MEILPLRTEGSIEQVIATYKSTVYGIALTRTGSRQDADDVFQEVFLAYFRKHPHFREEGHRRAWLINTTLNCTKKLLSRRPGLRELDESVAAPAFSFRLEADTALYAALGSLPQKYRTALYLFYFEDLPVDEIGRMLHVRPGTVRMQMTRGRALLREKLKGDFFDA